MLSQKTHLVGVFFLCCGLQNRFHLVIYMHMEIKYLGHSSFFIRSKLAGKPETRLVTDPFDPAMVGRRFPKVEAEIVTVSHNHADHNQWNLVGGRPLVIDWPGQFEKQNIRIYGYRSYHDKKNGQERGENILYKIEAEGITILHCGDLGYIPEESFLDDLGEINILLVPVGGYYTIDASEAAELVKKIEPSIVVPMHYKTADQKGLTELATVNDFLKKFGVETLKPEPKLVVRKEELGEELKIVLLEI
ncbi:MAG: MBL fold metallo-hydrolase [Microgenomates group bacterium]|nr:MBL fold metallo-hydrolase [Microgenomates group bacterium]